LNLEDVVNIIKESPSSLFYGAGVSVCAGGPSWRDLLLDLKNHFPEGIENDPFKYLDEIISFDDSNRKEVEDFLKSRLASISPNSDHKYLFSIPWRAVITTNYDHLPEAVGVTLDEKRQIIGISDPIELIDHRKTENLYCFKLLGDVRYSYNQGGWMVLSESDLFSSGERRTSFFNQFRNLAASGHVIYIGYSFNDNLIFKLLYQMKTVLGRFPWKGFAISPNKPDANTIKKLGAIGIDWVQGDLHEFILTCKKVFGEIPKSSPLEPACLTIHQRMIELDHSTLSNIHNKYSILNNELLRSGSLSFPHSSFASMPP